MDNEVYEDYQVEDARRMCEVALRHGFVLYESEALFTWRMHSQDWDAGWLFLPEDDGDLMEVMMKYCLSAYKKDSSG